MPDDDENDDGHTDVHHHHRLDILVIFSVSVWVFIPFQTPRIEIFLPVYYVSVCVCVRFVDYLLNIH
jgi:hypothetical protein